MTEAAFTSMEQDQRIADAAGRERSRLLSFIRRRVPDPLDAEDVLQDVFYRLLQANRLVMPIDDLAAWLFRAARNRITDLLRQRRPLASVAAAEGEMAELLPSRDGGPDAEFERKVLLDALTVAIDALPEEQRTVFVAHEIEGRSFNEISAATGVNLNTLLSRKRYAVLRLRERLQDVYDDLTRG